MQERQLYWLGFLKLFAHYACRCGKNTFEAGYGQEGFLKIFFVRARVEGSEGFESLFFLFMCVSCFWPKSQVIGKV